LRQFISVHDVPDINGMVKKALDYKSNPLKDKTLGVNKRIGCLFLNPSMRTRLSTQIAAQNLGMEVIIFNVGSEGWALEFEEEAIMSGSTVEHVKDAAPIMGKYFDILAIRTFPSLKNRDERFAPAPAHLLKRLCQGPLQEAGRRSHHAKRSQRNTA